MPEADWELEGTYLEACNCTAICPCRSTGGRSGGRSTYGICLGTLSWSIERGQAGGVDLGGRRVAMINRYDDDEPGSPWDFVLFVDDGADAPAHQALADIFLGRAGGTPMRQFPWAYKPSRPIGVRTAAIEIDHTPRRGWFRVGNDIEVRVRDAVDNPEQVTCLIPGHHRHGHELITDLRSSVDTLEFSLRGRCGYEAGFAYSSG